MYVKYNGYTHQNNECSVVVSKQSPRGGEGRERELIERWDIQGRLQAADSAALATAIRALEAAYVDGGDLELIDNDGATVLQHLRDQDTVDGLTVIQRPSYPVGSGAEFTTFRHFAISIEAKRFEAGQSLISWQQAINYQGTGGPTWGYLVPLQGPIIAQQFTEHSVVSVSQSGMAVQIGSYPVAPAPLYPSQTLNERTMVEQVIPDADSQKRVIRWSYTMLMQTNPLG